MYGDVLFVSSLFSQPLQQKHTRQIMFDTYSIDAFTPKYTKHDMQNPKPKNPCYSDLRNGDCLFFALAQALFFVTSEVKKITTTTKETMALVLRFQIISFIEKNWNTVSAISNAMYHDSVTNQHNLAIPEDEACDFPYWGESSIERLQGWFSERDELYGSPVEIMAFVEMMLEEHNICVTVRVWREKRIERKSRMCLLHTIP